MVFYNVQNGANVASTAQQICRTLLQNLDDAHNFYNWLAGQAVADLTALGFSSSDIAYLRGAFGDLMALAAIIHQQQPPTWSVPAVTTTAASATVTAATGSFSGVVTGMQVSGTGIPTGTYAGTITPGSPDDSLTLVAANLTTPVAASSSGTVSLTVGYPQVSYVYDFTRNANEIIGPQVLSVRLLVCVQDVLGDPTAAGDGVAAGRGPGTDRPCLFRVEAAVLRAGRRSEGRVRLLGHRTGSLNHGAEILA